MRKKITFRVLSIICLAVLTIALMAANNLATGRKPKKIAAKEDTIKPVEVSNTKSNCENEPVTKADTLRIKEIEREMIAEDIRYYNPKVPEYIAYLEENYNKPRIYAPESRILGLGKSRELKALPVLSKVLSLNPRPIYRVLAIKAIVLIEDYHNDKSAVHVIIEALADSNTDVQSKAAEALVTLGDTSNPLPVLTKLARGDDKENWTVDWAGYMGLENATEEEIEYQKKKFKNRLQSKSIELLGELSTKEAISVLRDIASHTEDEKLKRQAEDALNKIQEPTPKMRRIEEDFATRRDVRAKEDTAKSTETIEAKQAPVDITEQEPMTKADSLKRKKLEKEVLEEYRERYLPLVPEHIKFLEQNYKSTLSLELCFLDLQRALDLRALPVLTKILLYNPRGINRAGVAKTIRMIEKYNNDDIAIPALVKALNDTITDVQFNAAKALANLGDTLNSVVVLTKLARGEDKVNWTVDWAGYMGLENATEEEVELQKKKFKDGLQSKAIKLLGELSTKEAVSVLKDIAANAEDEGVKKRAKESLKEIHEHVPKTRSIEEDFATRREPGAKEETVKSTEILEAKEGAIDTTKPERTTKADSLKKKEFERERIEEDIRYHKPKVDQYIKYLEENYDNPTIVAPEGCISCLGKSRELKAIQVLSKVLLYNPRSSYRRYAARAIKRIELYHEDQSAIPALKEASQTPNVGEQLVVLEVLIDLGEKESAVPLLFSIFKKERAFFKMSLEASIDYVDRSDLPYSEQLNLAKGLFEHYQSLALKMLIEIGSHKVEEGLEQCLNSQDEWIREKAQNALEKITEWQKVENSAKELER